MLTYTAITSLDGYVNDASGAFDWARPDDEVHGFVNDLERSIGTYQLGRRMYEVLSYWDVPDPDWGDVERDYAAVWQASDKVVYSTTLDAVGPRARLERTFDAETVRALAADGHVSVGGPGLAAHALAAGLVDEVRLLVNPVAVGGGTPALPPGRRLDLSLMEQRRFGNGVVYLQYGVRRSAGS